VAMAWVLLVTSRSRCQRVRFRRLGEAVISGLLSAAGASVRISFSKFNSTAEATDAARRFGKVLQRFSAKETVLV